MFSSRILSKSFNGSSSIVMPTEAIIRDTAQTSTPTGKSLATHARKQEMKIAVKQVRLPATVFPPVNGI